MTVIITLSVLHIVALGLLWLGLRRPRAMAAVAGGYVVVIIGVITYQTGLLAGPTAASQLPPPSSLPIWVGPPVRRDHLSAHREPDHSGSAER